MPTQEASLNVLLISTLARNPGDEIIRLGQEYILRQILPDARFKIVNKHDPRTLFEGFAQHEVAPHRLLSPLTYRLYAATNGRTRNNNLEEADLVVFAGGPFIWRNQNHFFRASSANAEWVPATWMRLFRELRDKPVLNLAAGTSVDSDEEQEQLLSDKKVAGFVKRAIERTALTTARDKQTWQIAQALGLDVPLIPCTAILAALGAGIAAQTPEYVVVNVIRGAAPSRRGDGPNPEKWKTAIQAAVADIEKRHKILFVSHTQEDDQTAAEWFPNHPRIFSMDPRKLLSVYSKALYGVCNRVHAGAAIAGFARPVIVVGGDSRIDLIRQMGLQVVDHRELDAATLLQMVANLEENYESYTKHLHDVMTTTERRYLDAVSAVLAPLLPLASTHCNTHSMAASA